MHNEHFENGSYSEECFIEYEGSRDVAHMRDVVFSLDIVESGISEVSFNESRVRSVIGNRFLVFLFLKFLFSFLFLT